MSYRITAGLGAVWTQPERSGPVVNPAMNPAAARPCDGGVFQGAVADGKTKCCPKDGWSNQTYLDVKDAESLQKQNEDRVHWALGMLLDDDYMSSILFEHDASLPDPLKQGLGKAYRNFVLIFPPSRWQQQSGAKPTDCGNFSVWRSTVREVDRPETNVVLQILVPPGRSVQQWFEQALDVIVNVPAGHGDYYWLSRPVFGSLLRVDEGGDMVPTPWLQSFIDTFAGPSLNLSRSSVIPTMSLPTGPVVTGRTGRPQLISFTRRDSTQSDPLLDSDLQAAKSGSLGVVALAIFGMGAAFLGARYLAKKRR